MSKPIPTVLQHSSSSWRQLFEAALLESNRDLLPQRLRAATDAIMDEIEDSFLAASQSERLALMTALNAMRELRRLTQGEELPAAEEMQRSSPAA